MILSKLIRAQEGVPTPQSDSQTTKNDLNWPKTHPDTPTPKKARSALSMDPTGVTSAINHFVFTI